MMSSPRRLLYLKTSTGEDSVSSAMARRGWEVHVATDAADAVVALRDQDFRVGLVHLDPDANDASVMQRQAEELCQVNNRVNWVALLPDATDALSRLISTYFYDYHTLPVDDDRLMMTLGHAYGMSEIAQRGTGEQDGAAARCEMFGSNPIMQDLFQRITKVASIDLNVLIHGESGTGKELTAHAIHRLSSRGDRPFVAVNCGALPGALIQAELFGHEKGAFTGADRRRVGRIEAAQNGTLFLDEIGDLPLDLQANLLRFLQEKTIERVGSTTEIPVDVRVIAATHVDLDKAVEEGRFREDLFYRLHVLNLNVPALRERGDDVTQLARHFFEQFAQSIRPDVKGISQQAMNAIRDHTWPGNVRELINRIQRAVVMADSRLIKPHDLGLDREPSNSSLMTLAQARDQAEKEVIESTLAAVRNNVSKAARRLNISRVTLYRLMELHAIDWQRGERA